MVVRTECPMRAMNSVVDAYKERARDFQAADLSVDRVVGDTKEYLSLRVVRYVDTTLIIIPYKVR